VIVGVGVTSKIPVRKVWRVGESIRAIDEDRRNNPLLVNDAPDAPHEIEHEIERKVTIVD
jgi:hypothetical protein